MKKTLVSALTTALVVGAASTTFAASNPFSDVPADHWAYDAVAQLAADGVIEGYGDTTFRGNQSITRYEMAQMVAKAMAKTDVSAADKALIDKLAAEFSDELNNLGVRVSNLERNADMVKWNGQARYTYRSLRTEQENGSKDRDNSDKLLLRLEPSAEVNDHWHVKARLDATTEMSDDKGAGDNHDEDKVSLKRVYAQGNYKNFQTQLGKFGLYTPEQGLVFDSDNSMSGANVTFGNALKTTIYAGRIDVTDQEKGYDLNRNFDDTANMQGITLQYATPASKWSGGAAYYHLNTNDFVGLTDGLNNNEGYTNGKNDEDNANIWSANLGYNFDNTSRLFAAYANNTSADNLDKSWQAIYSYKGAEPENKNTWGAYAAYRYLGTYTSIFGTEDAQVVGAKGWEVGANYAPFHNVLATAKYFNGKGIDSDRDVDTLWGRIQFFF
ncbi:S-layer homology domain-containing protein [Mitsuokella multacida]|uniref:S-layer protein n=1 Tax=Mitsuokella multacida TaxID=52226 RepID=A0A414NXD9_9FIRM|nr:S-layer homology domain-containing protein [Mitsuokella multacida]RHF51995.1 S-layer protein [Mitsuokella multacida]